MKRQMSSEKGEESARTRYIIANQESAHIV
jgi:hypothetical protein